MVEQRCWRTLPPAALCSSTHPGTNSEVPTDLRTDRAVPDIMTATEPLTCDCQRSKDLPPPQTGAASTSRGSRTSSLVYPCSGADLPGRPERRPDEWPLSKEPGRRSRRQRMKADVARVSTPLSAAKKQEAYCCPWSTPSDWDSPMTWRMCVKTASHPVRLLLSAGCCGSSGSSVVVDEDVGSGVCSGIRVAVTDVSMFAGSVPLAVVVLHVRKGRKGGAAGTVL